LRSVHQQTVRISLFSILERRTPMLTLPASTIARKFILVLMASMAALLVAIGAFNYGVDPYWLFMKNPGSVLGLVKPRPLQFQQEIKTVLAARVKPRVLIVGNSTMEIGMDPEALQQASIAGPIFNLGIAGFTLAKSTPGLRQIVAAHKPDVVLIGLAFSDFLILGKQSNASLAMSEAAPSWQDDVKLYGLSLFGSEATSDSLKAVTLGFRKNPQTLTYLGFNPMKDFAGYAKVSGYRVLFETANKRIFRYLEGAKGHRAKDDLVDSKAMAELQSVLDFLVGQGIRVKLIMSPYHDDYFAAIAVNQLQPVHEAWKEAALQLATRPENKALVDVFDFGCTGKVLSEPIPKAGDHDTIMSGYWDSEHFKPALGTKIAKAVFEYPGSALDPSGQLGDEALTGYHLTPASFPAHHLRCRGAISAYQSALRVH
jgi:hypothetical protein